MVKQLVGTLMLGGERIGALNQKPLLSFTLPDSGRPVWESVADRQ
jgi:hypothetical protein